MLHIYAVDQTILRDSWHSHTISNDLRHIYHIRVFRKSSLRSISAKCEVPCWQQQLER